MKKNFWAIVVFAVLVAVIFHLLGVTESFAGAWDSRDPEVVRAEGIVQGIRIYTLPSMARFEKQARDTFLGWGAGEKEQRALAMTWSSIAKAYYGKMARVEEMLGALERSSEKGKELGPWEKRFAELYAAIEEANNELFPLIRRATHRPVIMEVPVPKR